jgi:uncharacterized protein
MMEQLGVGNPPGDMRRKPTTSLEILRHVRIAVIGSGISGLSAAWLLAQSHDVTLFEASDRLGGHSNTVLVAAPEGPRPVDTGFIVLNTLCYDNLIAFFECLGVPTAKSSMTFAVSLDQGRYEYSGSGAQGVFGQPSNLFNADHWRMTRDILRFFREADALRSKVADETISLGAWLAQRHYSQAFIDLHILPMAAAIWSAPTAELMAFPAAAFARFFANHGLLQVRNRPEWRTVQGGSKVYVNRIAATLGNRVRLNRGATALRRGAGGGVTLSFGDGTNDTFDHAVLACHADQALALLTDADTDELRLLSPFRYAQNIAVLHTDATWMPRRKRLWSSWNYIGERTDASGTELCVTYWMNKLQTLETTQDYFVTLNPTHAVAPDKVVRTFNYAHPLFDARAMAAQRELWSLQGRRATWFAGSYFGYGFHEDGVQSGLAVAEALGGTMRPWTVANPSSRIHVGPARMPLREAAE